MKISDIAVGIATVIFLALFLYTPTRLVYASAYNNLPILISFLKFAILATFGELLILRIKNGRYYKNDFGLIPKMLIWGILGIFIYFAFGIFSSGVPTLFSTKNIPLLNAFLISFFMNLIFAPIMMLTHHITDMHINDESGKFNFKTFSPLELLKRADWDKMWSFVFKKTIPFFWIPAHTLTFMLPSDYRTLFAALLSVVLGILLAISTEKKVKENKI